MALVAGFILFAIVDPPLGIYCLIAGAVIEVGEATFWYRYLKRIRIKTGAEAMAGRRDEVVDACRPRGRVKIDGEFWNALCEQGADPGETVEIEALESHRASLFVL